MKLSCLRLLVRRSLSSRLLPYERRLPTSPQRFSMFPATESTIDTCYDLREGAGRSPGVFGLSVEVAEDGAEHWGLVEVCPASRVSNSGAGGSFSPACSWRCSPPPSRTRSCRDGGDAAAGPPPPESA